MCAYEFEKTIILKVRKCGEKNIDTFFSSGNKIVVQRDSFRNQGKQQPRNELLWNHCEINLCEVKVTFGRVATKIAFSLVVFMVFVALSGLEIDSSLGSVSQIFVRPSSVIQRWIIPKAYLDCNVVWFCWFLA